MPFRLTELIKRASPDLVCQYLVPARTLEEPQIALDSNQPLDA
jgi:hypothetical protein